MSGARTISFRLNGLPAQATVEPRRSLADMLRDQCGLTGTHLGCEHGVCGACTVIVDAAPVRACLMFGVQAEGASIRTVEGLADGERLHPLQDAFRTCHALQCGFCTPGFLMLALWLLESPGTLDEAAIREVLSSNLCRCTGYGNILRAVVEVAVRMGKWAGPASA